MIVVEKGDFAMKVQTCKDAGTDLAEYHYVYVGSLPLKDKLPIGVKPMSRTTLLARQFGVLALAAVIAWVFYGMNWPTLLAAIVLTGVAAVPLSRWLAVKAVRSNSKPIRLLEVLRACIANESPSFDRL
jgi:hypothetical protein